MQMASGKYVGGVRSAEVNHDHDDCIISLSVPLTDASKVGFIIYLILIFTRSIPN